MEFFIPPNEVITMFIVIIDFPPIQPGKDAAFREWFVQTNEEFGKH